eukprot:Em0002g1629a
MWWFVLLSASVIAAAGSDMYLYASEGEDVVLNCTSQQRGFNPSLLMVINPSLKAVRPAASLLARECLENRICVLVFVLNKVTTSNSGDYMCTSGGDIYHLSVAPAPPPARPPSANELANSFNMTMCSLSFSAAQKFELRILTANLIQQYCTNRVCSTSEGQSLGQVDATNVHLYGVKSVTSSNGEECVVLKMYVSSEQTGVLALSSLTSAVQAGGSVYVDSGFNILQLSSASRSTVPAVAMAPAPRKWAHTVGATLLVSVSLLLLIGGFVCCLLKGKDEANYLPLNNCEYVLPSEKWY